MSSRTACVQQLGNALGGLDDAELASLVSGAEPLATGIGGTTARIRVEDSDVFVKQLPLSGPEVDRLSATGNLFELPAICHYGIGSPGFGVARELAVHQLTSHWVLRGATDSFPIMYHWRSQDRPCMVDLSEFDGPAAFDRWGVHGPAVQRRVEALRTAEASVAIFLEYIPGTLKSWLSESFAAGGQIAADAFGAAVAQIIDRASWMWSRGLLHCDLHPGNILVRDGRLLLTDFGLSMSRDFDLDPAERQFFDDHGRYDRDSGLTSLLHWVLTELGARDGAERMEMLRAAAADSGTSRLAPVRDQLGGSAVELISRHAAPAIAFTERFAHL